MTRPAMAAFPKTETNEPNALLVALKAISVILAVRLFLLLSVLGSIGLAFVATLQPETNHGIYVLVAYCTLTVLPLVWLSTIGK